MQPTRIGPVESKVAVDSRRGEGGGIRTASSNKILYGMVNDKPVRTRALQGKGNDE